MNVLRILVFPKGNYSQEASKIEETLPLRAKEKKQKSIGTWGGGLNTQNNSSWQMKKNE